MESRPEGGMNVLCYLEQTCSYIHTLQLGQDRDIDNLFLMIAATQDHEGKRYKHTLLSNLCTCIYQYN